MPVTIVVADDDLEYREIVRALLEPMSDTMAIVGEAADGEAALALVRRERPDIVITDLMMPRLNGVERGILLRGLAVLIRILQRAKLCPSCGRPIPKDAVKCPRCATWLPWERR